MSLTKQIHLYSIATDSLYDEKEQFIHKRLLKLYKLRKDTKYKWKKSAINRIIKKEKNKLTKILDERLNDERPRELNPQCLIDKNIISLFESSLTRALKIKTNELTTDLFIMNVFFFQVFHNAVRDGFLYNGEKYIFLTASAGQIRTKKAVFIREAAYNKIQQTIMCGLTIDRINECGGINPNKFLAYLALANSATDVWEGFDIDKSIVVDDFETCVEGEVDYIDDVTYEITRKRMKVPITHSDGMGIMLDKPTRMCRLPFVKGLMVYFPFDKFIKEKCPGGRAIVTDIYGEEHDILKEDIRYIFCKSMFKLNKYYANWQCYKAQFKGNNCEACYCNIEEDEIPKSRINYQMLQTLTDMSDKEIEILTKKTIEEINTIGNDYQTTMKLLGATDYNKNPSYFQQALMIYPELFKDHYCRDVLKQTKKSLVKQAKAGRLRVNGGYYFVVPDLYAFCENLFLGIEQPAGLLKNGEVYIKEFSPSSELACLRSPHLYREWPIRTNNRNEETDKWLGGTKCLYISTYDLISKIVQCDFDGDKVLVIKDKNLTAVAKRNMEKIVPLDYKLGKANSHFINSEVLYEGMSNSYTGGNIGPISNQISRVWNLENIDEEKINTVKWLCYINNQVIDYAKTLWKVEPPKEIQEIIKKHTKGNLPNFFIYAKDKTELQVELPNNSTMNRIAASIPSPLIKFNKNIGKFDYRMLMNLKSDFSLLEDNSVIKSYDYWNTHQYLFNTEGIDGVRQEDLYMFQEIKKRIINETGKSLDYIVNTLVAYLYTVRPSSQKKMLWACFGDVIVENLKKNTVNLGKICDFCGKRFQPQKINQRYCSNECYSGAHLQQIKNWKSYQMVD